MGGYPAAKAAFGARPNAQTVILLGIVIGLALLLAITFARQYL
jgi:hypothetical protein